jgi:hypothetical protein
MRAWSPNLPPFDQPATDRQIKRTDGQVPGAVRLVLDLASGGVKLTPGGRLPRSFVRQVQEHRPGWYPLDRPAALEEDLLPLANLHDLLRQVGLLRLRGGVLHPTKAASDDLQVVRRLRSVFEPGEFDTIVATTAIATVAATGPQRPDHLAARVFPQIGYGWAKNGRAITEQDVHDELRRLAPDPASPRPDRHRHPRPHLGRRTLRRTSLARRPPASANGMTMSHSISLPTRRVANAAS